MDEIFDDFFAKNIGLTPETQSTFKNFMVSNCIKKKRGHGYNQAETEVFDFVSSELQQGRVLTLGTSQITHLDSHGSKGHMEVIHKGVVGGHAYSIHNAYERDDKKFILVKNPWGNYVRDYKEKKINKNGEKVMVLTSVTKDNLSESKKLTSLFAKKKTQTEISNSALPLTDNDYKQLTKQKTGYFQMELGDFCKNGAAIVSASLPSNAPANIARHSVQQ